MKRQPTLAVAGLFAMSVAVVGGCANPRGTANALSAVIPVSSPAASSPAASSPAASSPAASSPVGSSPAASNATTSSATAATDVADSTQISGVATADFEKQLVISYVGGDCDVSARGQAVESAASITVYVLVLTHHGVCSAVGYGRTAIAQLSAPWGNRAVRDVNGATVPVIDGALLLRPSWLPDGYQGGETFVEGDQDGNATSDQEWGPPLVTATSAACPPTPGVSLLQGYGITAGDPLVSGRYALANGAPLTVTRDQLNDLHLYWTPPGHPKGWTVALQSTPACGNPLVPLDTLLKIANDLH